MAKLEKTDVELMLCRLEAKILDLINKRFEEVHCRISRELETPSPIVNRDYQRDTYDIVKRLSYEYDRDKKQKKLKSLEEKSKMLNDEINALKQTIAFEENSFYNN